METRLSQGLSLLAHETEKSRETTDFELKKSVIRTPLISLSTLILGGVSQLLGAPLAFSLTPSGSVERVSL